MRDADIRWPLTPDEFREVLAQQPKKAPIRRLTRRDFEDAWDLMDHGYVIDLQEQLRRKWTP